MIKFNINTDNYLIISINFHYDIVNIDNIKVKYLQVRNYDDEMNIGCVLEKHRKFKETKIDGVKYKMICDKINKARTNINGFKPPHLIILTSNDEEISHLTKLFSINIINNNDIKAHDIFGCILKIDKKSITEYKAITDEFLQEYSIDENKLANDYISKLLIVDDVIKEGRLVNQILIRLAKNKNIDSKSEVLIYTLYSFKK